MRLSGVRVLILWALLASVLGARESVYPEQERFAPGPALVELAAQRAVALSGVAVDGDRVKPAPGDGCSVLVSMRDGKTVEQWLITFSAVDLNDDERAQLAKAPPPPVSFYTSTGGHYEFPFDPLAVEVWVAGPLDQDERRVDRAVERVKEQRARFLVNAGFLSVGLDRAAEMILRLRDSTGKVGIGMNAQPFPEEEVVANRARLRERGVTEEDERSVVGSVPALVEFFRISAQTPGLKGLLMQVIDVPWWALVKGMGNVSVNMNMDGSRMRRAPDREGAYVVPFAIEINNAPAMMLELLAVTPRAPASTLAGVQEVFAGRPNGKGERASIQLLSAWTSQQN